MSGIRVSEQGDTVMQTRRIVLQRVSLVGAQTDGVLFSNLDEDCESRPLESYRLNGDVYREMGCPSEITVTIEPGDMLNADL